MSQLVEIPIDNAEGREVLVIAIGCETELLMDPCIEDVILGDIRDAAKREIARRRAELSTKGQTP